MLSETSSLSDSIYEIEIILYGVELRDSIKNMLCGAYRSSNFVP